MRRTSAGTEIWPCAVSFDCANVMLFITTVMKRGQAVAGTCNGLGQGPLQVRHLVACCHVVCQVCHNTSVDTNNRTAQRTLPFFLVALGITWLFQLPAVLALRGIIPGPMDRFMLPAVLGGFGPLLAALLVSRFESGGPGVGVLLARLRIWRVNPAWYVVVLGIFAAIYAAGALVYTLLGSSVGGHGLYLPENSQQVAAMIVVPIAEEPGWRGFALPRLQQRYGALKASLLLGIVWGAWHTTMFILQGFSPAVFAIAVVNILAGSVIFSWIYNRTKGSLLLAILAHVGAHLSNPTHSLPGNLVPFVVYTVAVGVFACALLVGDRRAWRARLPLGVQ